MGVWKIDVKDSTEFTIQLATLEDCSNRWSYADSNSRKIVKDQVSSPCATKQVCNGYMMMFDLGGTDHM